MNKRRMKLEHEVSDIMSVEVPETPSDSSIILPRRGNRLRGFIKSIFNRCSQLFHRSEDHLSIVVVQERMRARGVPMTSEIIDFDKLRQQGVIEPLDKSHTIIADGIAKVLAAKHGEKLP